MTAIFLVKPVKLKISLGQAIKKEREALGWTIHKASSETRLPEKYLNAIEDDQFDILPIEPSKINSIKKYIQTLGGKKDILVLADSLFTDNKETKPKPSPKIPVRTHAFFTADHVKISGLILFFLIITGYLGIEIHNLLKPPILTITEPNENATTSLPTIIVRGRTDAKANILINEKTVFKEPDGAFLATVDLAAGRNTVTIQASRKYSKPKTIRRTVIFNDPDTLQTNQMLDNFNYNLQ